jgi:hypothetical protein
VRHRIGAALQDFDVGGIDHRLAGRQPLDPRFQPVRHFAQAHRAGQARPALERMQGTHAGAGVCRHGRLPRPVAQLRSELGKQFERFLLEDREQLQIDRVDRIDVVVDVAEGRGVADMTRTVRLGRCRPRAASVPTGPGHQRVRARRSRHAGFRRLVGELGCRRRRRLGLARGLCPGFGRDLRCVGDDLGRRLDQCRGGCRGCRLDRLGRDDADGGGPGPSGAAGAVNGSSSRCRGSSAYRP